MCSHAHCTQMLWPMGISPVRNQWEFWIFRQLEIIAIWKLNPDFICNWSGPFWLWVTNCHRITEPVNLTSLVLILERYWNEQSPERIIGACTCNRLELLVSNERSSADSCVSQRSYSLFGYKRNIPGPCLTWSGSHNQQSYQKSKQKSTGNHDRKSEQPTSCNAMTVRRWKRHRRTNEQTDN